MNLLREFLKEGVAHPIGSSENQRVKRRIQDWLDAQGIAHSEQRTWACDQRWDASCGFVENIVATIPGRDAGPYVALMAHYDSVPASPGAGDDMAGVVAVLETARAIMSRGVPKRPILLLITDGEETGLHGAHAFFSQHPLAEDVAVVLNVEGSGTRGASIVLRTSPSNRWFMDLLAGGQRYARGSSVAAEVFSRMPNDTDFSVPLKAGVPGIDFSFAGERAHYHTPSDNPDVLDPRTIQHHGENLLPLTLDLANASKPPGASAQAGDDVVFQDLFGVWLQWPTPYTWYLLGFAGALLLASSWRLGEGAWRLAIAATLIPALTVAVTMGAGYGALQGLDHFHGTTVEWPAHLWAFRLTIGGAAVFACCLLAAVIPSRFTASLLALGAWWFYAILVALLLIFLSGAAGAYLVLLVPAVAFLTIAIWLPLPVLVQRLCIVATLVPAVLLLTTVKQLEDALGYQLALAPLALLGIYMALALPFLRGPWLFVLGLASLLSGALAAYAAITLPLYSDYRPQQVNVRHYEDADAEVAYWRVSASDEVPSPITAIVDFDQSPVQLYPWDSERFENTAKAQYRSLLPPRLTVLSDIKSGESREITLRLASQRKAWTLGLFLPREAALEEMRIGAATLQFDGSGEDVDEEQPYSPIYFHGTQRQSPEVKIVLGSDEPIDAYLVDFSTTLPDDGVVNARPLDAGPVHTGDLSLLWQKFSF